MKAAKKLTKAQQSETLAQAQEWQRSLTRYLRAGLCHICAAQAAFGHSIGFSHSHPPCAVCAPIVAAFPHPATAPWRKLLKAADERRSVAAKAKADAA